MTNQTRSVAVNIASYVLAAAALFAVLQKGLLAALFAGLLVYSLIHMLTPLLGKNMGGRCAKMIAVAVLSTVIVGLLTLAIWSTFSFLQRNMNILPELLQKTTDIIEASRNQIPEWLRGRIPGSAEALKEMLTIWLREHAVEAKTLGEQTGRTILHLLIGMVIGAMTALYDTTTIHHFKPLAAALHARVVILNNAFQCIVFAQVRIAAINAVLTGIYLLVALPLAGIDLPFSKTMVAITFFAGLLPVVGNLISNTVLVVVGLSHSLHTAVFSLVFLVTIHKLEYFLNAKIIGSHINARVWELLSAMLVMEALFGLPGVIAAPVLYAYIKKELTEVGLV